MESSKPVRTKAYSKAHTIGLSILSVFIIWHAIAITMVGPFGMSYLSQNLKTPYKYYLSIVRLEGSWPFYAPAFLGSVLSYETISNSGESQIHELTLANQKFEHAYFRYTNFYAYLFGDPEYSKLRGYDKSVARFLCEKHIASDVNAINFILLNQTTFTKEDYIKGKRSMDKEFLEKTVFGPYNCPQP